MYSIVQLLTLNIFIKYTNINIYFYFEYLLNYVITVILYYLLFWFVSILNVFLINLPSFNYYSYLIANQHNLFCLTKFGLRFYF